MLIDHIWDEPWLALVPLAATVILTLKGALIYAIHRHRFAYLLGGYIVDGDRALSSKIGRFLLNVMISYGIIALGFWLRWQLLSL